MSMNKNLGLILLFLLFSTAYANLDCESLSSLDNKSEECKDNTNYTSAGKNCLKKLEDLILKKTKFTVQKIKSKSSKINQISRKNRELILDATKDAMSKVQDYRNNIFYPEDWDAPEEVIGDGLKFMNSQKCYADANKTLKEVSETLSSYINIFSGKK